MLMTDIFHTIRLHDNVLFVPHFSFNEAVSHTTDPTSFSQAVKHSHLHDAMLVELQALEANHTRSLTSLPFGKKPIGCKWVFKTKLCANGSIE